MSRKTRKLIWSVPLVAVLAVVGALAIFAATSPGEALADHEDLPGPVTGLKATAKSRTSLELTWTAPAADAGGTPAGYRIDYSDDNRVWTRLVENTMSTQTSHMVTEGVSSTTRRHYRVFAINSAGTGPISKAPVTAFVNVGATYPAVAPDAVTLTAVADGPNKIKLSWTAAVENGAKVTGYTVEEMVLPAGGSPGDQREACASANAVTSDVTSTTNCLFIVSTTQMTKRTAESANLLAGTTHFYRVTAVTATAGNSVSNVVGVTTTGLVAPDMPTGLVAVPVEDDIRLYWIEPTSTGGHTLATHEIQYQTRANADAPWPSTWSAISGLDGGGTAGVLGDADDHEFSTVAAGQYQFRMRAAQNDTPAGEGYNLKSGWTNSNTLTSPAPAVADTTVPLLPTLTATALDATTVDGEGIRLTWMPSLGTDGLRGPQDADSDPATPDVNDDGPTPSDYRIDRSEDGLSWKVGQTSTVTIGQWEDFEPDAGDERHYRILPLNGNIFGEGAYDTATATAANVSDADLLLNLTATGISTTEIRLNWGQPSGAVSYDIYRAEVTAQTGLPGTYASIKMGHDMTTYTDSKDLKPGDEKWYRVVAKNKDDAAIAGTGGAEAKGRTLEAGEPAMPVDLVVESAADSSFTTTSRRGTLLLWNEPVDKTKDPETAYQIQRKVNDGAWETIMENTMNLSTHYNDEDEPEEGEMRVYRVLARSGTGVGMPSNEAHFPADTSHDPPPELMAPELTATKGTGSVTLMWNEQAAAVEYTIWGVRPDGSAVRAGSEVNLIRVSDVTATTYEVTGLMSGQEYWFAVTACEMADCGAGNWLHSNVAMATPD